MASRPRTPEQISMTVTFNSYQGDRYSHTDLGLSPDVVLGMYRGMLLQRRFEERSAQMYGRQKIAGFPASLYRPGGHLHRVRTGVTHRARYGNHGLP